MDRRGFNLRTGMVGWPYVSTCCVWLLLFLCFDTARSQNTFLGGGTSNTASGEFAAILGGENNVASGDYSTIGAGQLHVASGSASLVVGGSSNTAKGTGALVVGGASNWANLSYSAVCGGNANSVGGGSHGFIGGGYQNSAHGYGSTVGGGIQNTAAASHSNVAGGKDNVAAGTFAGVASGWSNSAGDYSNVGGGRANLVPGQYSAICGGFNNNITQDYCVVGGGQDNEVSADWSVVVGGRTNTVVGPLAFVGGGRSNRAADFYATVSGGLLNSARGLNSFVGGGGGKYDTNTADYVDGNIASGKWSTIAAGRRNIVAGNYATIVGGFDNTASGFGSFVGGGGAQSEVQGNEGVGGNEASGLWSAVVGGYFNHADGHNSAVGGGHSNFATASYTFVGGGSHNRALATAAMVSGGTKNSATGVESFIGGGAWNVAHGDHSLVAGGLRNAAKKPLSTIGGGHQQTAVGYAAVIGGGESNLANASFAIISGGRMNVVEGNFSTVTGGEENTVSAAHTTVGGGASNRANSSYATISGGLLNAADATSSTIGGGVQNTVSGIFGVVGGGRMNAALTRSSTSAGGELNTADGTYATISGGYANEASASGSVVGGGTNNSVSAAHSTVGGGNQNTVVGVGGIIAGGVACRVSSIGGVVGGGDSNTVAGLYGAVAGGYGNHISSSYAVSGGGFSNSVFGSYSVCAGGSGNLANATHAVVSGGIINTVHGDHSTSAGGSANVIWSDFSSISGGQANTAGGTLSSIGGGSSNVASGFSSLVSGGHSNVARGSYSTIAGGHLNSADDAYATLAGGYLNSVFAVHSFIGGGSVNIINTTSSYAVIGGGSANVAKSNFACLGGGLRNTVAGDYSSVGGGFENSVSGTCATIAGGISSVASGYASVVAGGRQNKAVASYSSVGGGYLNSNSGSYSCVGGGNANFINGSSYSSIAGGYFNEVHANFDSIGGGVRNHIEQPYSVIAGGYENTIANQFSSISGGRGHTVNGLYSHVGGGFHNFVPESYGFVGGGTSNSILSAYSTIAGGSLNVVDFNASSATIGGGNRNVARAIAAFIGGGTDNLASGKLCFVSGGLRNTALSEMAGIGGGRDNLAAAYGATVCGGLYNTITGVSGAISGGDNNEVHNSHGAIGGGSSNQILMPATYGVVGGGLSNVASGSLAVVAGGHLNSAAGWASSASGGANNVLTGNVSSVGGGQYNSVLASQGSVGGGTFNLVTAFAGTVAGGRGNTVSGLYGFVGGGLQNSASGNFASVCGGENAHASGNHSFVAGGMWSSAAGSSSAAFGNNASAQHSASAVFAFTEVQANCSSVGAGSVNFCVDAGLFINGIAVVSETTTDGLLTTINLIKQNVSQLDIAVENLAADFAGIDNNVSELSEWMVTNASMQQTRLKNLDGSIQSLVTDVRAVNSSFTHLEAGVSTCLEVCHSNNDTLALQLDDFIQTLTSLNDTVGHVQAIQHDRDAYIQSLENNVTAQQNQIETQQGVIAALDTEVSLLRSTVDILASNMSSLTHALTSLMQETSFAPVSATTIDCSSDATPCTTHDDATVARGAVTAAPLVTVATTPGVTVPTLHSVELTRTNSSTSSLSTTYVVKANASSTNGTVLKYVFSLVEVEHATDGSVVNRFVVEDHFDSEAVVPIPISRDYFVLVEVVPMVDGEARTDISVSCQLEYPGGALNVDNVTGHVLCPVAHRLTSPGVDVDVLLDNIQNPIDFVTGLDILAESSNSSYNSNGTNHLFNEFYAWLSSGDENSTSSTDQSILVVSEFLDVAAQASDQTLMTALLDGISEIGDDMASTDVPVTDSTVEVFLDVIDEYATHGVGTNSDVTNQLDVLQVLDDAIDVVCATNGAAAQQYNASQFVLSCGHSVVDATSNETAVIVSSGDGPPTLVFSGDDSSTVSVTEWNTDIGGDLAQNSSEVLGDVVGVSFAGGDDDGVAVDADQADEGFQIAIDVSGDFADDSGLRKRVSCQYWEKRNSTWTERGVFLRGLSFDGANVVAICMSSHLTLFTVTDESAVAEVVEEKISTLSSRFSDLGEIDLLDADTELNYLVPVIFAVVTAAFIIVVVVAKTQGRSLAVNHARKLFVQEGRLHRETVIRGIEYEAILRGWMPVGEFFRLVGLDVATGNTFLSLMFSWSHEQVVFTRADKAFMLYAAFLSTFLVQSFLADISTGDGVTETNSSHDSDAQDDFGYILLHILVGALFANILMFPIKYLLPFMISNVTSFTTSTDRPKSLYRRHMDHFEARLRAAFSAVGDMCANKHKGATTNTSNVKVSPLKQLRSRGLKRTRTQKQMENDGKEFVAKLLQLWTQGSNLTTHSAHAKHKSTIRRRLRFFGLAVRLPRAFTFRRKFLERAEHSHGDDEGVRSECRQASSGSGASKTRRDSSSQFVSVMRRLSLHSTARPNASAGRMRAFHSEDERRAADRKTVHVVTMFQRNIRLQQYRRRILRGIEFDAWHYDCRRWRIQLSFITGSFLLILGFATLMVCLLVSAAFTLTECLNWAIEVAKSLLMQLFVTDPAFTLFVFGLKIFFQWALFRADKQQQNVEAARSLSVAPDSRSDNKLVLSTPQHQAQKPTDDTTALKTDSPLHARDLRCSRDDEQIPNSNTAAFNQSDDKLSSGAPEKKAIRRSNSALQTHHHSRNHGPTKKYKHQPKAHSARNMESAEAHTPSSRPKQKNRLGGPPTLSDSNSVPLRKLEGPGRVHDGHSKSSHHRCSEPRRLLIHNDDGSDHELDGKAADNIPSISMAHQVKDSLHQRHRHGVHATMPKWANTRSDGKSSDSETDKTVPQYSVQLEPDADRLTILQSNHKR